MATSHKYHNTETKRWSYGAEIEVVDWPNREPLQKLMPRGIKKRVRFSFRTGRNMQLNEVFEDFRREEPL